MNSRQTGSPLSIPFLFGRGLFFPARLPDRFDADFSDAAAFHLDNREAAAFEIDRLPQLWECGRGGKE